VAKSTNTAAEAVVSRFQTPSRKLPRGGPGELLGADLGDVEATVGLLQSLSRHHGGHEGLGGVVEEGLAGAQHEGHDDEQGDARRIEENGSRQRDDHQSAARVDLPHHSPPVPAVHEGAAHEAE
jgi:hypothetical protein